MVYAAPAWCTASISQLRHLQRMQNRVLRSAAGAPWFMQNTRIHSDLNIPSIGDHIEEVSTRFFAKLLDHANLIMTQLIKAGAPRKHRRPQDIL